VGKNVTRLCYKLHERGGNIKGNLHKKMTNFDGFARKYYPQRSRNALVRGEKSLNRKIFRRKLKQLGQKEELNDDIFSDK